MESDPVAGGEPAPAAEPADPSPAGRRPSRSRWWQRMAAADVILALGLLLCYGFFRQHPLWNEYSRYDLVQAIVETGTPIIDAWEKNTGDKAFYDGHFYSDKAPGSSLLGVPVEVVVRAGYALAGAPRPEPEAAIHALSFAISGVPTVVLVLLLLRFLRPAVGRVWALVIGVGYGLGTIAFPFATMYFGHAASAACLFTAFYLVWRWRADPRHWRLVAAGALAGLAVITEIPVVLGVAVLGGYALWVARRRALLFVVGGLPLLAVLLAYNTIAFDHPFSLGYQYTTGFAEQNSQGIVSIVWPSLETTGELLLGPRGLLTFAPWLGLAPLGLAALRGKGPESKLRPELLVALAMVAAFLTYNSGALNPLGGATPGPRYLVPALPFAAILVALAPRVIRPLAGVLIAVSVAIFAIVTSTESNPLETVADPLREVWLPRLLGRDLAESVAWVRWGLHGLEPLIVLVFGALLAAIGLAAAERRVDRRRLGVVIALQVILVVAFALPLPPVTPLAIGRGDARAGVVIVDAGAEALPAGARATTAVGRQKQQATLWAQLENAGGALAGTRVTFTLTDADGHGVWSAWFDRIDWASGERKQIRVDWVGEGTAPVSFRVGVAVTTPDRATVYGQADDAATLRVGG